MGNFLLDVDFDIEKETLALLGASGCGKSMTLKCIAGIEKPDEGKIVLNDRVLFDSEKNINLPPQERKVGLLFQSYALFPNMTLKENINIAVRDKKDKSGLINNLIKSFSLTGLEDNYPDQLSGGQKQRVALARMIVNEPEILMLDEPFSALDEHLRWQMEEVLVQVINEYKVPIVYVSHNKDEVYRISDKIAIMKDGKILEIDNRDEIFNNPKSKDTGILIGYKNISSISIVDPTTIHAKDWNIDIKIDTKNINANYIGLKEDEITISENINQENRFLFKLVDKIKNINHDSLVLLNPTENSKALYIDINKSTSINYEIASSIYIHFPLDSINLFY